MSAYYPSAVRNKRSLTLTLASGAGVLVENFRLGKMAEWGLGYEDLRADNPDLVYCKVSGYSEDDPHSERPAYALIVRAEGGMLSITGEQDAPLVRVGVAIADLTAGLYAAQAVIASLSRREFADASGEKLDVSLFDTSTGRVAPQEQAARRPPYPNAGVLAL